MGLNPAIILLALSVWGTLLGIIGMIIALPLTTILLAYYQEYIIGNDKEDGDDDSCREARETLNQITNVPETPVK